MLKRSGRMLSACWAWLRAVIGPDELGLLIALALVATGLWWVWKPGALIVPGLVLLWLFLPVRSGFVARHPAPDEKVGKKS